MGLWNFVFGGGGYNATVKKNTTKGRLTKVEFKKLMWERHDILDQKQREEMLSLFPGSAIYGPDQFKRFLRMLGRQGIISRFEGRKIFGLFSKYF